MIKGLLRQPFFCYSVSIAFKNQAESRIWRSVHHEQPQMKRSYTAGVLPDRHPARSESISTSKDSSGSQEKSAPAFAAAVSAFLIFAMDTSQNQAQQRFLQKRGCRKCRFLQYARISIHGTALEVRDYHIIFTFCQFCGFDTKAYLSCA